MHITYFDYEEVLHTKIKITMHFFSFFCSCRAAPAAYGGSQARGQIEATAAGLHHSNAGFEPRLQPKPQLMAT